MKIPETMKAAVLFGPNDLRVVEKKVPKPGFRKSSLKWRLAPSAERIQKYWPMAGRTSPLMVNTFQVMNTPARSLLWGWAVGFSVGDRVAIEPHKGCGVCAIVSEVSTPSVSTMQPCCSHRHYGFTANGGYAQYTVNHINTLHPIPDALNFEEATLITTAGTAMYGVTRVGGIELGENVVINGPGPIGLMAVQVVKQSGAGKVIITGTRDERLSLQKNLERMSPFTSRRKMSSNASSN